MNLLPSVSAQMRREFQRTGYSVVQAALPLDLTTRWRRKAEKLKANALTVKRSDKEFQLVYRVVTGDVIHYRWHELFSFYRNPAVLAWIKKLTGERTIYTSPSLRSAVNLNIMESTDSVYRWHFDAVPYTMLLYLNDVTPANGGAMQIVPDCKPHSEPDLRRAGIVELWPTAGTVVLMDGTRCYHRVAQLLRPDTRFSIPLVYPNKEDVQRPAGLDAYLYKKSA